MDFGKVYREHYDKIWAFVYDRTHDKDLAKDLTQNTFLKAMLKINQYDKSKPILSWLFGIAHKQIIDRSKSFNYNKIAYTDKIDIPIFSDNTFNPENVYNLKIEEKINKNLKHQIS